MDCEKAKQLLHPYLDNVLPDGEKEEFQAHVFMCSGCRAELFRLERVLLLIEDLGVVEAPSGFAASTMKKVQREKRYQSYTGAATYLGSLITLMIGISLVVTSSISFFQNLSRSEIFDEGMTAGGYAFADGFFVALSYLETDLLLGLCLAFISSTLFIVRLMARLPNKSNVLASRVFQPS